MFSTGVSPLSYVSYHGFLRPPTICLLTVERRLEATGYGVGLRVLELLAFRSREYKRETKLMNVLQFVSTVVWKALFGKAADSLERSSTCCKIDWKTPLSCSCAPELLIMFSLFWKAIQLFTVKCFAPHFLS